MHNLVATCSDAEMKQIANYITGRYNFSFIYSSLQDTVNLLRTKEVCGVVHCLDKQDIQSQQAQIVYIKQKFPSVPWVVLLDSPDIEKARLCGYWNIDHVLCKEELDCLGERLWGFIENSRTKVSLKEINIEIDGTYSSILKDALQIIESNYVCISRVKDIAEILKVPESSLIREFQRKALHSPKQLLLMLKIRHAVKLMSNDGLSLSEIAHFSGFTTNKRMIECFHRIFHLSPGKFKQHRISEQDPILSKFPFMQTLPNEEHENLVHNDLTNKNK